MDRATGKCTSRTRQESYFASLVPPLGDTFQAFIVPQSVNWTSVHPLSPILGSKRRARRHRDTVCSQGSSVSGRTLDYPSHLSTPAVRVSDFEEFRLLIRCDCLLCGSCSSGQWFAESAPALADCLRIPPRDGHPCPRLAVPLAGPAVDLHHPVIQPPPCVLE